MNPWEDDQRRLLQRLRRVEGQVRGVAAMVEKDDDCEKVVQQFAAVRKAMDKAFFDLMACVTRRELADVGVRDARARAQLARVTELLAKYA